MAGIYIHVPFCRKICSYCDFYKTTVVSIIPQYLKAITNELELRRSYLQGERINTIYFGGGTPSLLAPEQIHQIIEKIRLLHTVSDRCEITLEANPDDLTLSYLENLKNDTLVNRISIGIQSFTDSDLVLLNRRHNSGQAIDSIHNARKSGFENISIDLIYGIPGMDIRRWRSNLKLAFSFEIKHLSAYHLSIEPGTALSRMAGRGLLNITDENESTRQFYTLSEMAIKYKFVHYEISNLAKAGYFSQHNSNYWHQQSYMGIGPSAHSFNIVSRQWNIAHVKDYINAIVHGNCFFETEEMDSIKRYNEYLMVSLRTSHGVDLNVIQREYGEKALMDFNSAIQSLKLSGHLIQEDKICRLTAKGWLISDYILSGLMIV